MKVGSIQLICFIQGIRILEVHVRHPKKPSKASCQQGAFGKRPKTGAEPKHKELICEKPTDPLGAPVS